MLGTSQESRPASEPGVEWLLRFNMYQTAVAAQPENFSIHLFVLGSSIEQMPAAGFKPDSKMTRERKFNK